MCEPRMSRFHAGYSRWAHLGSNQAYRSDACSGVGRQKGRLAGRFCQASTGELAVSSALADCPDGHRRDKPLNLGVNQHRLLSADARWIADSRELQEQGTARPLADLSLDARLCGQRVREVYE